MQILQSYKGCYKAYERSDNSKEKAVLDASSMCFQALVFSVPWKRGEESDQVVRSMIILVLTRGSVKYTLSMGGEGMIVCMID